MEQANTEETKHGLKSMQEAKQIVFGQRRPLRFQQVPIVDAVGLVLAADVLAPGDFPPFVQSNVDGYAFAWNDFSQQAPLRLMSDVAAAGNNAHVVLEPGSVMRVFTGAPVPSGADSVVMQEDVLTDVNSVSILRMDIPKGANTRSIGSDVCTGALVLAKGTILSAASIALLASMGYAEIPVVSPPRVAIIITGTELVAPGYPLRHGQVYDANGAALQAAIKPLPAKLIDVVYIPDNEQQISATLARMLQLADVVLLTGGASVGEYDFVVRAATFCGVQPLFHKVRQKPGKPLYYGRRDEVDVFGLPGNPASVLACLYVYVLPTLLAWAGYPISAQLMQYPLAHPYQKPAGITTILKANVRDQRLTLLNKQASYQLAAFATANALAIIPEDITILQEDHLVEVILLTNP